MWHTGDWLVPVLFSPSSLQNHHDKANWLLISSVSLVSQNPPNTHHLSTEALEQWFSIGDDVTSKEAFCNAATRTEGAPGTSQMEDMGVGHVARDAATYPTMHQTGPTAKSSLGPNANGAEGETPS